MPVVKKWAVLALLLFHSGSLSIFTSGTVFASLGNWVEVAKFTGGGGIGTTEPFTCDHVDWRIRWEIEPTNISERTTFPVYIFPYSDAFRREAWFESIEHYGTEETSGTLYIHDRSGSFDMDVLANIKLHNYNRTRCGVHPRVSIMDHFASNNGGDSDWGSVEEEKHMKKRVLIVVLVLAPLLSVMAGTLFVSLGEANPNWRPWETTPSYDVKAPVISICSPENNTVFNRDNIVLSFKVDLGESETDLEMESVR